MSVHDGIEVLLACRDDLSAAEERSLRRHLEACAACRALAGDFERQDTALRWLAHETPAPSVRLQVLAKVDAARRPVPRSMLAWGLTALAASLVLLVSLVGARGLSGLLHAQKPTQLVSEQLTPCRVTGDGWSATGSCHVLDSADEFNGPNIVVYRTSLGWARGHLQSPVYLLRKASGAPPIAYSPSASNVVFSEVAFDSQRHVTLYAIGKEKP